MIGISIIMLIMGIILAGTCSLLPLEMQITVPFYFKLLMLMLGLILSLAGFIMLLIRAQKTGAIHLLKAGRPGTVLWLYIYKDGTAVITPSIRSGESQLYSPELDSQVIDVKSYRLADHNFRIVPEIVGHAVDLDYVMYADLLKTRFGFENLKSARRSAFAEALEKVGVNISEEISGEEHVAVGRDIKKVSGAVSSSTTST